MKRALIIISILLSLCIVGIIHNYTISQQLVDTTTRQELADTASTQQLAEIDEALAKNEAEQQKARKEIAYCEWMIEDNQRGITEQLTPYPHAPLPDEASRRELNISLYRQSISSWETARGKAEAELAQLQQEHQELLEQRARLLASR